MQTSKTMWLKLGCWAILILMCSVSLASDTSINVGGTWTVTASNGRRKAKQTLVIQQEGAKITGTFKGPRQSGTLEGSVAGNSINFHVTAKIPLDYTGTVDGDSMKGSLSGDGKNGDWTATRAN